MKKQASWTMTLATMALGMMTLAKHCPGDDSPSYATACVQISATSGDPVTGSAADYCMAVPVQPGASFEQSLSVQGPLSLKLTVTRDEVVLEFEGAIDPSEYVVPVEELVCPGQRAETVTATDGAAFDVVIASCPRSQ